MLAEPNFERRLDEICQGLQPFMKSHLMERISRENASTIIEYLLALKTEINLSLVYREAVINTLTNLAKFHDGGNKPFKNMTRDDILAILERLRKSEEKDRKHRWIGTYNQNIVHLKRFYKWLYYPLVEPKQRPKPEQVQNVQKLRRKEDSNYEDHELWLDIDCNRIFLKYCPSVRDRAFHAMMLDTSCRPKELMNARIGDVQFIEEGYSQRHAIIRVVGKSGKRLKKILINSLSYLKDWLSPGNHPMPDNLEAHLLCGVGKRNRGRKLERRNYSHAYNKYKKYLKSLLDSPDDSAEDKKIIKEKMLTKPWRPYVLRYTSLNKKANGVLSEYQLREHADWTPTSSMPKKYLRFNGDESIKALQRAQCIVRIGDKQEPETGSTLAPTITCYNCKEPNKPGSRVCANPNCKVILSSQEYVEKEKEFQDMKAQITILQAIPPIFLKSSWDTQMSL